MMMAASPTSKEERLFPAPKQSFRRAFAQDTTEALPIQTAHLQRIQDKYFILPDRMDLIVQLLIFPSPIFWYITDFCFRIMKELT